MWKRISKETFNKLILPGIMVNVKQVLTDKGICEYYMYVDL